MKNLLLLVSVSGSALIALVIAAGFAGLSLPDWLTVENAFIASCAGGAILVAATDYKPRHTVRAADPVPAPMPKKAPKAAAHRGAAAGDVFASTLGMTHDTVSTGSF